MTKPGTRTETDSLGSREVRSDALYGIQTLRAVENFPITGQLVDPEFIHSIAMVKKAATQANLKLGELDPGIGKAILTALDEIIAGQWKEQFCTDPIQGGATTSINMNMNEVIANRALQLLGEPLGTYSRIHPNDHVNLSQSTNDVIPTAIRLSALSLTENLLEQFRALVKELDRKATQFKQIHKLGRTHLQDAVPTTLGAEFRAYAGLVRQDIERLKAARKLLLSVNLGGTAIGSGVNVPPSFAPLALMFLNTSTGYTFSSAPDLIAATQDSFTLCHLSSSLKIASLSLSKMANDLRLLSSGPRGGFAEISLPALQPGSSIMPGKVNPVILEAVNQVAFQITGFDLTISLAAGAGQLELNVMLPVLSHDLFQSCRILTNVTELLTEKVIKGIQADPKRCQEHLDRSTAYATGLAHIIGHQKAALIALEAVKSNQNVLTLAHEQDLISLEQLKEIMQC